MKTPYRILNDMAADIRKREGLTVDEATKYGLKVRNKREAEEHGWMPGAKATLTFEFGDVDLISYLGRKNYAEGTDYIVEAYASYMVGIY